MSVICRPDLFIENEQWTDGVVGEEITAIAITLTGFETLLELIFIITSKIIFFC